ncbi:hypothetical protein [Parapedobacter tibetensis]|uniref:hypothetical protein n=1 Tax=Parapedobacter tibetensis TaxID=2972951 RepID=UPI00214D7DC0|nr:hypothetical protein [Parapedobacter tibetensis]
MKNNIVKYAFMLAFATIAMYSCNQDEGLKVNGNEELDEEVFNHSFGQQILGGDQILRLPISELNGDSSFLMEKAVLIYYSFEGDSAGNWRSALKVDPNKDYRLHFSFGQSSDSDAYELSIEALDTNSTERYGSSLNFRDVRILAPMHSKLRPLNKADLDFSDYHAVTEYFGLDD